MILKPEQFPPSPSFKPALNAGLKEPVKTEQAAFT